ncbi:MAG TPA: ChbG/HpnK family deacetylase [Nitrospirota bacterium]|nr:ChbG/HpnK family deacetylase [Nitrospirota bacterium]
MARVEKKYAVIVADDFGSSSSVNLAVAEAYDRGILTAASLMAGGAAFEEAVEIARKRRGLSVGLHVTLCDGRAVLPCSEIPGLADSRGRFENSPTRAWMKYRRAGLLGQLDREIEAQFERLEKAGVQPTHIDGHHHLHMHPAIFELLCRHASRRGIRWVRIPREPLSVLLRFPSSGRGAMPFIEWAVFAVLGRMHGRTAREYGLRSLDAVYGLARTGQCDERYLLHIFDRAGSSLEIFLHPDAATEAGQRELEALTSGAARAALAARGVVFAGYRELSAEAAVPDSAMESV